MPKIKEVHNKDQNRPVIIDFQNGKIQSSETMTLNSALFKENNSNKKLVGVANGELVYCGEVTGEDYNTFLVVQNDHSRELQLVQVDTCTVTPLLERTSTTSTTPVKSQSLVDLKKQFGSRKAKRHTEQQERLITNLDNVKEHLENTVSNITVSEVPSNVYDVEDSLYKPKINRGAATKDQVYQLPDLVPIEILDSLEEKVSEILENDDLKEYGLIPTVEAYMLNMRSSSIPEKVVIDKCKILLFVDYLVKFMNTPLKNMTKKFIACDCSPEVDKYLKQNYMVNGTRPISIKDKGLCYIIVLLVLAMDYESDLEPIAKDLRTGLKKMQEFARNLGFSQSTKSKTSIVLKIPVPPPVRPHLKRKRN